MEFLKSRFNPKDISMWTAVLAAVLGIIAAIVYPLTAANEFNPNISTQLIVMLIVAVVVEIASLFARFKEVRALGIFLFIYDLIIYAGTQGNYLANILVSIDGSSPSGSLIGMLLCLVLALIASIVSTILLREKRPEKKEAVKE